MEQRCTIRGGGGTRNRDVLLGGRGNKEERCIIRGEGEQGTQMYY